MPPVSQSATHAQRAGIAPSGPALDLMTTEETATLLRCSPASLRSDICRRRWNIPFVRIGRSIRYNRPDVLAWVAAQNSPVMGA